MKLLRRTVRNYIIYSALLMLVCTPLYYLAIHRLFVNEMEEELFHHKENFHATSAKLTTEKDLELYQLINEEFSLKEAAQWPIADSLFSYTEVNSATGEQIPFRALRTSATVGDNHYELIIRESLMGNSKLVLAIVAIQTGLLILMLLGFILINRKLSKAVWDPFYTILEKLKQYQIDKDINIELPRSFILEFRDLREAIIHLVNKSREAYLSQKEFTENASHELQTPLAVIRSKLELLMQSQQINHEQAELISDMLNATDRISRLNKNLLLLSKIENRQFIASQEVHLKELVSQTIEHYKPIAQSKLITLSVNADSDLVKNANPILLDILIGNLISNALKHSPEQSEVKVLIAQDSITVTNPGEPLKNPEKIFNRFNREAWSAQGNGLGLAIVKKICEVEALGISYHYENGEHNFKISF